MIRGIAHICIGSKDLAATERFYCAGLGFSKAFNFIRNGDVFGFYLRVAENSHIEVFRQDEIQEGPKCPIRHMCFEVDDIESTVRRLKDQGYDATEKQLGADRSWQAWTTDPGGVRIEFHQYTAESSQKTGRDCRLD